MAVVLEEEEKEFVPDILAFCCNWCSYAGADMAGISRLQMPPHFRIIRVMCSGRVEPEFVMKALNDGADGVMVLACHIGDCHYIKGNHRARDRMALLHRLLDYIGVGSERLYFDYVSAGEPRRFASVVSEFSDRIRRLGPNPLKRIM